MNSPQRAVLSPCIGVCRLDAHGFCEGCHRTGSEIASWMAFDEGTRMRYMDQVLPARAAQETSTADPAVLGRVRKALHALATPPGGAGWNYAGLDDLLPPLDALTPAAVLVGLVPRAHGWTVLLTLRTDALRNHGGQVSFPGGRMEPHDAGPVAAALREAHEEIGLRADQVEPLGYLDAFDTISGFHVWPVVARVAPDYVPVRDAKEVAAVFEAPLDFLMDARNVKEIEREFAGRPRRYHEFSFAPQRIWGATAAMLVNLRERLEGVP